MSTLYKSIGITLGLVLVGAIAFGSYYIKIDWGRSEALAKASQATSSPAYEFSFNGKTTISEASNPAGSESQDWWIESGGLLKINNGTAQTLVGNLAASDSMRKEYAVSAPVASDNGYHPQNVFRMITQKSWQDSEQTAVMTILGDNLFNPNNSNSFNGLSLLARYQNDNNYYYFGVRMDGGAVIKKKTNGQYYTLAIKQFFPGKYDQSLNPNLLPKNQPIGLRSRILTNPDGSVSLQLYVDQNNTGSWKLAAEAVDDGSSGGKAITKAGKGGVLTDYMDVQFSKYQVSLLGNSANSGSTGNSAGDDSQEGTLNGTSSDQTASSTDISNGSTSSNSDSGVSTSTSGKNGKSDTSSSGSTTSSSDAPTPPSTSTGSDDTSDASGGVVGGLLTGFKLFGNLAINRTLQETGSMSESPDGTWWLNSGGYVYFKNGIGSTAQGDMPANDPWRKEYASSNPTDTDGGLHPQNLFRLVSKDTSWKNYVQQAYFKVDQYHLSNSSERDGFNGILFFNRYADENNLYYTGIRTDGNLEIKKKKNGTYYTMLIAPVFPGKFDRSSNPNLLPMNQWIGFRTQIQDTVDGKVDIKVFVDTDGSGNFKLYGEAVDDGKSFGGAIMDNSASVGIRTDFMDAEFKNYSIKAL
jgi:hypothetical protein